MRHISSYGCCILLAVLCYAGEAWSATWEFHPGVYASYLYTDNYEGTAEDKKSENIYAVGPSMALSCTTQHFQWSVVGHVAKNWHQDHDEDDTTEGSAATYAQINGQKQSLGLAYNYHETRERETLDQPLGVYRYHVGSLTYNRILSPGISLSMGYNRGMEYAPDPDEDVVSDGGTITLSDQVTPKTLLDLTAAYNIYHYEFSPNAQVAQGSMRWLYTISPKLRLGPQLSFERHTYDEPADLPAEYAAEYADVYAEEYTGETDVDIYTAAIFMDYSFSPYTVITASAGGSWLEPEDEKSQYTTNGRLVFNRNTRENNIMAEFFHGYAYEYDSQHDYEIYQTTMVDTSWDHFFTPSVLSTLGYQVTLRTSTMTEEDEDSRDYTYRVGMTYRTAVGKVFGGISDLVSNDDDSGSLGPTDSTPSSQAHMVPAEAALTPSIYESISNSPLITHWPRGTFEVRALYEHLEHAYEDSDSIRENRYSISIEVRY